MSQWSGGASIEEYAIHPIELAVSCLGHEVETVRFIGATTHPTIIITFSGSRVATIDFNPGEHVPFLAMLTTCSGSHYVPVDDKNLFFNAASTILDFFDTEKSIAPRQETIAIHRVLEALRNPVAYDKGVMLVNEAV